MTADLAPEGHDDDTPRELDTIGDPDDSVAGRAEGAYAGGVLEHVVPPGHVCRPPGPRPAAEGIGRGSVWRCSCGNLSLIHI